MNANSFKLMEKLIPSTYVLQAQDARRTRESLVNQLLEKRKWPEEGWDDDTIKLLLEELAAMDSNNFLKNAGVGEREARIASSIVASRHFNFGHGIGRSGDLVEVQPKAAGSSILYKLTNSLALDALRTLGVPKTQACFVAPLGTGMSLTLVFLTLRQEKPLANYIIWSRIDQKSCFKSILAAGFQPVIIEPILHDDELRTDSAKIESVIQTMGSEQIACVMTTTSCFAPRSSDSIEQVAAICLKHGVAHVINNAYGAQSSKCMHLIQQASRKGRVDIFVQSTDKNFMVPVGGTIIAGFDRNLIAKISQCYPGRASSSPILDLFITLLSLGSKKYSALVKERKLLHQQLKENLSDLAAQFQLRILSTPGNSISIGVTLPQSGDADWLTALGSKLFLRCVSGTRVVSTSESKTINGCQFRGWGAHTDHYPFPYITVAATVGMKASDVSQFLRRFTKVLQSCSVVPRGPSEDHANPEEGGISKDGISNAIDLIQST